MRLQKLMGERFICLMGNHEDMAIEAYDGGDWDLWDGNHGETTRRSFAKNEAYFLDYVDWLKDLPLYYENESFICVHAGVSIHKSVEETRRDILLWDRDIADGRELYRGKLMIHGHTPVKNAEYLDGKGGGYVLPCINAFSPLPDTGSINLDTGCVFGYNLTAMVIDEEGKEFKIIKVPHRE